MRFNAKVNSVSPKGLAEFSVSQEDIEKIIAEVGSDVKDLLANIKTGYNNDYIPLGGISLVVKDGNISGVQAFVPGHKYYRVGDAFEVEAEYQLAKSSFTAADGSEGTYEKDGFHLPSFFNEKAGERRRAHEEQTSEKAALIGQLLKNGSLKASDLGDMLGLNTLAAPKQETVVTDNEKPVTK